MRTALAILFLCLAAASWAAPHPQNQASGEQANSSRAIANALGDIAATYNQQAEDARRSPERHPCEPGQDNRQSDLCAQWKAADAADRAAWWARFSGALSFVGLLGVAGALLLTVQSNWITRDAAKRQLRAYIDLEDNIKFEGLVVGTPLRVRPRIRNNGATPAREIEWVTHLISKPLPLAETLPIEWPEHHSKLILGKGQSTSSTLAPTAPMDQASFDAIMSGQHGLFVWGRATYVDVFGDKWRTDFRIMFDPKLGQFYHCDEGNEST